MSESKRIKRPFINLTFTTTFKANVKPTGKTYHCSHCKKPFSRPSALKTHSYTHTGERPHACDIMGCGRRFTVISNLRRHMRVHEQPHSRRRLNAQQRRAHVERLMHKTNWSFDLEFALPPPLSFESFSPSSTPPTSPNSICLENTSLRFLKPKVNRPHCLCIENLLN